MAAICLLLVGGCKDSTHNTLWPMHTIGSRGNGADGVHLVDIDSDGDLDVVSAWEGSDEIKLYFNPGAERITDEWSEVDVRGGLAISDIEESITADLDGDGRIDSIVSASEGSEKRMAISWLIDPAHLRDPASWSGEFLLPDQRGYYMATRVAQIDGAGGNDIVSGSKTKGGNDGGLFWFRAPLDPNRSNMGDWERFRIGDARRTLALEVSDINGDGSPDVFFSDNQIIGWYEHPGNDRVFGAWTLHIVDSGRAPRLFTLCDVDADGSLDILVATNDEASVGVAGRWYRKIDEVGDLWESHAIKVEGGLPYGGGTEEEPPYSKGADCGDLDGDGKVELVFVARGYGTGAYALFHRNHSPRSDDAWRAVPIAAWPALMKYDNIQLSDIDGDGDLDVITTEEEVGLTHRGLGVIWYENQQPANPTPRIAKVHREISRNVR